MQLYQIINGKLTPVPKADVYLAGLKETSDLESWVRDAERIFDRDRILWISRQERTPSDERADLLGISNDELVLVELKRGRVEKEAVSQALSYLAQMAKRNRQELLDEFIKQAAKTGPSALYDEPLSEEEASKRFASFEPKVGSVNQLQRIILVGTDFSAEALQVCGFLNENLAGSPLTLECWRIFIYRQEGGYLCSFDKVLPSRDVETEIEERREERRANSYKRDPNKVDLMKVFKRVMGELGVTAIGRQGQTYECELQLGDGLSAYYYIGGSLDCPELWIPEIATGISWEAVNGMENREDEYQEEVYKVVDIPLKDWSDHEQQKKHVLYAARVILKLIGRDPAEVDAIDRQA